ncbi:MAG: hypothetical protein FWH22_08790 [Fibromonadales bacterium]|nr:hypothetical protein [Fibromonadales bacterium]
MELEEINERFNIELQSLTPENANGKILMLGRPSDVSTYAKTDGQLSKWVDAGLVLYVNKNRAPDYLRIPATLVTGAQNNQELRS